MRPLLLALALGAGLAGVAGPAFAQGTPPPAATPAASGFTWEKFDVVLVFREDMSVRVIEVRTIRHGPEPFRSGSASLPVREGQAIETIRVGELVNGSLTPYQYLAPAAYSGQPGTYGAVLEDERIAVDWAMTETANATRTFLLDYVVRGAVTQTRMGDYDAAELRWTVISGEITDAAPVEAASLTIITPYAWPWVGMKLQAGGIPKDSHAGDHQAVLEMGRFDRGETWTVTAGVPYQKAAATP